MTPTEQDKGIDLFSEEALKIAEALRSKYPNTWRLLYDNHVMPEIIAFITADRKRVALEAFDEGYEAGRKEKPPKLVDAVEFRRESYGWSKGKMAAMLDMTKSHYSEFIHGTRGLPVNSIRKAYAIGIPAQVFRQDYIDRQLKAQQEESK